MHAQFTTLRTADILDALADAVDTARASTAPAPWQAAIDRAWDYLLQVETIEYNAEAHAIRVESATRAGRSYVANGECQCEAFTRGAGVCWHRAAARLVRRALELQALAAELIVEAHEGAEKWFGPAEARTMARWYLPELTGVAAEWDEMVEVQRKSLGARIGAAQAAAMARPLAA